MKRFINEIKLSSNYLNNLCLINIPQAEMQNVEEQVKHKRQKY